MNKKKLAIAFDTETTGFPIFKEPSEGENQPHIVQLAARLFEEETGNVIQTMDVIVKPDGWVIPDEAAEVHGITTEYAMEVGIPEKQALEMFLAICNGRKRVAFNTTFDNRIIRIATKRFSDEKTQEAWHTGEYECAMIGSRKIIGGKQPKLSEAYKHFTGKELVDAHSALADTDACLEVYLAIKKAQQAVAA